MAAADAHVIDVASGGGEILNIVSSVAKSKRSAAAVQPASLRPFRGGGGGGGQAQSQCLCHPPMQHPPKVLHSHLGHTLTTLSKSVSGVVSPDVLSTIAQSDPKSPDCVVDDDDNDVNDEEDETDVTTYAQC